jgi:sugar lactone lactonase YvrE
VNFLPSTVANPHNHGHENRKMKLPLLALAGLALSVLGLVMPQDSPGQNIINTYAGSSPANGQLPLNIDLPGPTAAIRDASGNTYIAAPYSTDVFELTGGVVNVYAGQGYGGYGGDKGPVSQSILALPAGLNIDSKGNIYIVDPGNSRVRMVTPSGTITTIAGGGDNGGTPKCEPNTAPCGDGGPANQALLNLPQSVAFDSTGNVYIADSFDNRIRVVNTQSTAINVFGVQNIQPGNIATVAGSVNVSSNQCPNPTSQCGDTGPATSALLYFPEGVAFDSVGNMYIADTRDNRIRMVNPSGTITTVVGTGSPCLSPTKIPACGDTGPALSAKLHVPTGVLLDSSNNIYVADSQDFRVRKVSSGTINTIAGNGFQGYSGDGGAATSAKLNLPNSLFLDSAGNLLIADMGNQVVRQVAPAGSISTIVGGGSGGDGGAPASAFLANPFNVAEDSAGNLYIADTANNRIRKVNASGTKITTVAGTGILGYSGDGDPATSATLNGPTGVAVDTSGDLYIADAGNLVVRKVNAGGTITTYAGNGLSCKGSNCGTIPGPALNVSFDDPQAVAVDSAGNLYIVDYNANQVRKVDPSQNLTNFAGTGNTGLQCVPKQGQPLAVNANLDHPSGITVDSAGNVYIDDSYANEICKVDSTGTIKLYTFNGAGRYAGDGGPALSASQWNPLELSMDPGGNLFIGGGNNSCIRRVDALTYTIGTVAGDAPQGCIGGFGGDGLPAVSTTAKIAPQGLVADGQSNLYIADNANNRIRSVQLAPAGTLTPPKQLNFGAWPIGQTSTPQTLTIKSSGGVDLTLNSFAIGGADPGDFTQTGTTCGSLPATFGVDVTCTVTFTFTPATYGPRTATFTINDNATNSPQTVTLSGDGPYYTVNANPTSITINQGSGGTSTITLTALAGFNQQVTYTYTGCPTNGTCSVSPSQVQPGTPATLTVNTASTTPKGQYTVTVKGTYGALQAWAKVTVTVQ